MVFFVGGKGDPAGASREAREQGHAGREAREQGQQRHVATRRRGVGVARAAHDSTMPSASRHIR